jgi:hypothetical protein
LHKEGRLTKRPAPPGAGNRVYLSLSGNEASAAEKPEAESKTSPATTNGDHEGLNEGGCDHDW